MKFYRYQPGFMHHKVILVDDDLAAVGTANFDNRSIRLNFEMMLVFADRRSRRQSATCSKKTSPTAARQRAAELASRPFWFHFAVRLARLMAPDSVTPKLSVSSRHR